MLDKVLTGENVKVNGEIAGRRHILRTLYTSELYREKTINSRYTSRHGNY